MGGKKRRVDGDDQGTAIAHAASADSDSDSDAAEDSEDEGVDATGAHAAATSDQSQVCEPATFALGLVLVYAQSLQCVGSEDRVCTAGREHSLTSLARRQERTSAWTPWPDRMCFLAIALQLSAGSSLANLYPLDLQDVGEAPGETFAELGLDDRLLLVSITLFMHHHALRLSAIPHNTCIDPTLPSTHAQI